MLNKQPRFKINIRTDNELFYSSYFFAGLYDLVADGLVNVTYNLKLPSKLFDPLTMAFRVFDQEKNNEKMITIDWRDNSDMLCMNRLSRCDIYFKRNFIPEYTLTKCPPELQHKIRPAGLSYAIRTYRERPFWVRLIGAWCRLKNERHRFSSFQLWQRLRFIAMQSRMPLSGPTEKDFQINKQGNKEPLILFQVKAYDAKDSTFPEDTEKVTEERALIIRALRGEFGDKVIAGFVATPFVLRRYPDLAIKENTSYIDYINIIKRCKIGIYSRGLRNSPAFKMAALLATRRCIVAEPLKTVLPKPLIDGQHLLYFTSIGELLGYCLELIKNKQLRDELSEGAFDYYEKNVKPKSNVLRILESV